MSGGFRTDIREYTGKPGKKQEGNLCVDAGKSAHTRSGVLRVGRKSADSNVRTFMEGIVTK